MDIPKRPNLGSLLQTPDVKIDIMQEVKNMYESPISIMTQNVSSKIREEEDKFVNEYLINMGIHADKEELVKALQYDRDQYNKGYKDAHEEMRYSNPYWHNVTEIAKKQREKGLREYGAGLEDNPSDILERIGYIEEELVDALMYLEWAKESIKEWKTKLRGEY